MDPCENLCDAAEPWQLGSQEEVTLILIDVPHDIKRLLVFYLLVFVRVLWEFAKLKLYFRVPDKVWTISTFILFFLACVERAECACGDDNSSSSDGVGKLTLPSTTSSPVPSISSRGASWIDECFGPEDTGSSVNQPVAPPANQVASPGEEAGPSNPVRPFPYHDDDLIGGDSVRDIRSGSPGIWFPSADPEIPPEPGMPQGAPGHEIQHPIPRLDQPLISDRERFIELQGRFHLYYLGRNRITDLAEFAGRLERAVPIERHIEAALVFDGYDPDRIRGRINEIRGILFTHPTRVLLLSEQTLDRYLNEIETNGTRQSAPYMRLVSAIRN